MLILPSLPSPSLLISFFQAVMNKVKGNFFRSTMANMMMTSVKAGFFTTRTVDELLWGYEDPLLARVSQSSPDVDKFFGLMYKAGAALQTNKLGWIFYCSFCFVPSLHRVTLAATVFKRKIVSFRKMDQMTVNLSTTPGWRTTWIMAESKPGKVKGSAEAASHTHTLCLLPQW